MNNTITYGYKVAGVGIEPIPPFKADHRCPSELEPAPFVLFSRRDHISLPKPRDGKEMLWGIHSPSHSPYTDQGAVMKADPLYCH